MRRDGKRRKLHFKKKLLVDIIVEKKVTSEECILNEEEILKKKNDELLSDNYINDIKNDNVYDKTEELIICSTKELEDNYKINETFSNQLEIRNKETNYSNKRHKLKLKNVFILTSVIILIIITFTSINYYNNKKLEEEKRKNEEELVATIKSHFNKNVKVTTDAILYSYNEEKNEYQETGMVYKDIELVLDDLEITKDSKYFYVEELDSYIEYQNVLPIDEIQEHDNRYTNYIPFNKNVITNDTFTLYNENEKVYSFNESMSFPIIINNYENKYYIEFDNRLLYLLKDDIKEIVNSNNTNVKNAKNITTFCYHRVYDTNEKCTDSSICKKKSNFDKEMKYLKDNNYLTLTMNEMYLYLTGKLQVEKPVLITLDDGHLIKSAIEVLEKYDLKATSFIKTKSFDDLSGFESDSLELHSHTHNMHTAGVCKREQSYQQGGGLLCLSEEKVLNDLNTSRERLNNPIALAYPFYDYNNRAMNLVKKAGFKMAFIGAGGVKGKSSPGVNLYKIPRMTIWDNTSFTTWKNYLS